MNLHSANLPHSLRNIIRELHHARARAEHGAFIAEGIHVVEDLASGHLNVRSVVLRKDASAASERLADELFERGADVWMASAREMDQMSDARTPQEILAVVDIPVMGTMGRKVLVADGINDPGNMGTIVRTAAWFGFSDVITTEGTVDMFNPKTVRAAAGALARVNVGQRMDVPALVTGHGFDAILGAVPRGGVAPSALQSYSSVAIVIGSESHGMSDAVAACCTQQITIPGGNGTESLNAAIAAALLCYEVSR